MLIQLPGGAPRPPGPQNAENCTNFEAGLRRDLASAPIVSYDAVLGGGAKRGIDMAIVAATAPAWAPLMALLAIWSKLRWGGRVFRAQECVGYGGRAFKLTSMRVARETGDGANAPANDSGNGRGRRARWLRAFEKLPALFNVLAGEMALVGPSPLRREQLEPLRTARRYYLSARPGVVGLAALLDNQAEDASRYKAYAMSWSFSADALIAWDALSLLFRRGPGTQQPQPQETL